MKKNIAIIAGGYSSEYEVSLKSASGIQSFLDKDKYDSYIVIITKQHWLVQLDADNCISVNKNDFSFQLDEKIIKFDFAYITIHGTPGENGLLQGYFEMLDIPYSTCDSLVSSLTFNKYVCVNYLHNFGIEVAKSIRVCKGEVIDTKNVIAELGLPIFVKPDDGGSSFGVSKVKSEEELQPAIKKAFQEGKEVMLESFISGTEVTCGCYKTVSKKVVLPITEVVTTNEFFDYDAKYNGQVQEITPARISDEMTEKIQQLTSRIYEILKAKGLIRVDYIITEEDKPVLLEINTTPGMTATSFIPQQVRAAGLNMQTVLSDIIENEFADK